MCAKMEKTTSSISVVSDSHTNMAKHLQTSVVDVRNLSAPWFLKIIIP